MWGPDEIDRERLADLHVTKENLHGRVFGRLIRRLLEQGQCESVFFGQARDSRGPRL
jgi:hypothetical protein